MTANLEVTTSTYGPGAKSIDIYRPTPAGPAPVVLLWHGIGPDERDVLAPLAEATARQGLLVYVPDWRPDAEDGGRGHLLESLRFVREHAASHGGDADRTVLAGWSAGASAAVSLALAPEAVDGWRPTAAVGIAGRYDRPSRITGTSPTAELSRPALAPSPVWLVHGTSDALVSSRYSEEFRDALRDHGWSAHLETPASDHAGVIMTEYDPDQNRCRPAQAEHARSAGLTTAGILATAASTTVGR
ncbi:putative esterase [Kitasatospora sp. GAS204A]|uniref:carboxylesterase family protein n=1 Tax=unclassified Kitasatospora TaxID=2633591 RepID=UPI002476F81C|nr:carboxylesterase family protein [Kitasatospora sp. GAS204B]MDH6120861.1 putative esterase [Kitasatospora sp. GAS204B]